jgi:endogenous inhibitor of DNA gyrase (YacG/DUF329 family)
VSTKTDKIFCPTCNKSNTWKLDNSFRPFCSHRCKLIDLGEWADEKHAIPGDPIILNDLPDNDDEDI